MPRKRTIAIDCTIFIETVASDEEAAEEVVAHIDALSEINGEEAVVCAWSANARRMAVKERKAWKSDDDTPKTKA